MLVKTLLLLFFVRHLKVSINFIIQFQECLLGFIIETIHTNLDGLCLITKDVVCLHNVNKTAGTDDLFDTTIIEGLADNICPVRRRLQKFSSSHSLLRILISIAEVGYSCSKVTGKRSRNASLRTLVPMNRPSSEPLPLVLAVAKIWNPLAGTTNLPIFFKKDSLTLQDGLQDTGSY